MNAPPSAQYNLSNPKLDVYNILSPLTAYSNFLNIEENIIEPQLQNNLKKKNSSYLAIFCVLGLSIIGLMLLYSADYNTEHQWSLKQMYTVIVGFGLALLISKIPPQIILKYSYYIYGLTIILLIASLLFGYSAMGAKRWLRFAGFNVQPSEFVKIGLILALAKFYHQLHFFDSIKARSIFIPVILVFIPFVLILKQPNLGTAGILFLCFIIMSFASGINFKLFSLSAISGILTMPLFWFLIHDYQKQRILTFMYPERDPFGAGYNVIQSKIAIGSGGVHGKGFSMGTQGQLQFLPEKHTDFIVSLLAEEMGFIGVASVLFLSVTLMVYLYLKSLSFHNHFSRLIVTGFCSLFFLHILINILMISGFFPVVGIPYPFLSYGRSNLLTFYILFGLVLNGIRHSQTRL